MQCTVSYCVVFEAGALRGGWSRKTAVLKQLLGIAYSLMRKICASWIRK